MIVNFADSQPFQTHLSLVSKARLLLDTTSNSWHTWDSSQAKNSLLQVKFHYQTSLTQNLQSLNFASLLSNRENNLENLFFKTPEPTQSSFQNKIFLPFSNLLIKIVFKLPFPLLWLPNVLQISPQQRGFLVPVPLIFQTSLTPILRLNNLHPQLIIIRMKTPNPFSQQSHIELPNIYNAKTIYILGRENLIPSNPCNLPSFRPPSPQKIPLQLTIFFSMVDGNLNKER